MGRLAVDSPGSAVVVRRRDSRLVIDVSEDLKAEFGVLVKNMQSALRVLAMPTHKVGILQQKFEPPAHLFAARWARVAREDGPAIRDELVELISHRHYSRWSLDPLNVAHSGAERQCREPEVRTSLPPSDANFGFKSGTANI